MKFQSVTGPEGFFMLFPGPVTGCCHDSFMLYESGLLSALQRLLPNVEFSIFGDPAYPNSPWLWGGFWCPRPGLEQKFNTTMISIRESVEWDFEELSCYFKYSELKILQEIYKSSIGKNYVVCFFFQNLRTTLYGNKCRIILASFQ
jgi:DDE superfamily endonuclease